MQMDKKQLLRSVRNRGYSTLDELVTEAARMIPHIAQEQPRYKVSIYPDGRTIRYYINKGLVDRPSASPGRNPRFNYRHLLQVLAIKHLQAQYLPLNKIKGMLAGLDKRQLEEIIIGRQEVCSMFPHIAFPSNRRFSIEKSVREEHLALYAPQSGKEETIEDYIEPDTPEEWIRVSITSDIEINIRAGSIPRSPKKRKDFIERLTAKLRIYLEAEKKQGGI